MRATPVGVVKVVTTFVQTSPRSIQNPPLDLSTSRARLERVLPHFLEQTKALTEVTWRPSFTSAPLTPIPQVEEPMLNVKTSETFLMPQSPASLTTVETSRSDKTASCTKLVRTPAREILSAAKQPSNPCVTNIVIRT